MLGRIGGEMRRLMADPGYIEGSCGAAPSARLRSPMPVLREVQDISGLLRP